MNHIRYSVAACQTDLANPLDRRSMRANTDRMLSMIDSAVAGAAPFLPVRLVVFPEFAHAAPVFESAAELIDKLAIAIPNDHTERLQQRNRSSRACDPCSRASHVDRLGSRDPSGNMQRSIECDS